MTTSPAVLAVLRTILVADIALLVVVGGLCMAFVDHPSGRVLGVIVWIVALAMTRLMPLTDPYRAERRAAAKEDARDRANG